MGPGKKEIRIQENMDPGPDPIVLLFSLANLTSSNSNLKKRSLLFAHPNWNWNLSLSLFLSLSALLKAHFPRFLDSQSHKHRGTFSTAKVCSLTQLSF